MAYQELIKNFDQIRSYMRDFFVYGFKTRDEYVKKSTRSYDNEKRRIESYLGDFVSFQQNQTGKRVYISLDGREETHNPLYRAFEAKSFTSKDITYHFYIMDILADGEWHSIQEMMDIMIEEYLSCFADPMSLEESTLRKKCKEYLELGIIEMMKEGKIVRYRRAKEHFSLDSIRDAIRFFTEESPLGVIGFYLENRMDDGEDDFYFKYHYRMNTLDMEIMHQILQGIHEKRKIEITNCGRSKVEKKVRLLPLKILSSVQGGRSYLMGWDPYRDHPVSFRIDYIESARLLDQDDRFDRCMGKYHLMEEHMWGVAFHPKGRLEHMEMDILVGPEEDYIIQRLEREKRCGSVTKIDEETYRFSADVYDAMEMVPWIRSFFGRIRRMDCTNEKVNNKIKFDIVKMAKNYEIIE